MTIPSDVNGLSTATWDLIQRGRALLAETPELLKFTRDSIDSLHATVAAVRSTRADQSWLEARPDSASRPRQLALEAGRRGRCRTAEAGQRG
jgi:hypothetical protein